MRRIELLEEIVRLVHIESRDLTRWGVIDELGICQRYYDTLTKYSRDHADELGYSIPKQAPNKNVVIAFKQGTERSYTQTLNQSVSYQHAKKLTLSDINNFYQLIRDEFRSLSPEHPDYERTMANLGHVLAIRNSYDEIMP